MGHPVTRAAERARRLYPRSKGFRGAYVAGARAALAGRTSAACPYANNPNDATWRKAWYLAWMRGHRSVGGPEEEG